MIKSIISNLKRNGRIKFIHMGLILTLVFIISYIIFLTGGTKHSYSNLMYIPIIMAIFVYGFKGGLVVSVLSGIFMGPYMPEDVKLGIMQSPLNWVYRTIIYIIVCSVISIVVNHNDKLNKIIQEKAYTNPDTGLPNINKLSVDLENIVSKKQFENYILIGFVFENMQQINRYVDFEIGKKAHIFLLNNAAENFKGHTIYSLYRDEFVVIMSNITLSVAHEKTKRFIKHFKEITYVEDIPINFALKCGIVNFHSESGGGNEILQKLGRTMDQVVNSETNIAIYDENLAKANLEHYNILIGFSEALKTGRLALHYHPKIDLKRNKVYGVEALVRWQDFQDKNVSIDKVIKIIEDAGFVNQLTKWVVRTAVRQLSEWQKMGLKISVSVNLSAKDLNSRSCVEYTQKCIKRYGIDPNYLEYELTERSIIENDGKAVSQLNELYRMGIRISIDDYGTGYNSLMNMISLPVDYIKIDKYFIKNMYNRQGRKLVEDMISLIHNLGKKVIAEGVETLEQLEVLQRMGCDCAQGYLYSTPVPSNQVINVISKINSEAASDLLEIFNLAE